MAELIQPDTPIPEGMFRCTGTIPDGILTGKPCLRLIRQPSPQVPVKRCPRCGTEHRYQNPTVTAPVWSEIKPQTT